jgi:hypothetical protein
MELNKRKSLLTPASPTVWGMIHGDIREQKDLRNAIFEQVKEVVGYDLINSIKSEVLAEINPVISEITETTQPRLETGVNIKSLKGRSILGEGDLDPLDENDRMTLTNLESNTQSALEKSDTAQNMALSATTSVEELRGYVDKQLGEINTITDDILG